MPSESTALAFAGTLAARCAAVLGDGMVAAILHGSLTLGGFVPGRSDIDLLVVVHEPLRDEQLAAVLDAAGEPPARVDLRFVARATAASPTLDAGVVLRPGEKPDVEVRAEEEPDVVVELSVARAHGRSLIGPAPATAIAPVPADWLVEIGDRQLAAWQLLTDDPAHAELMALTACRIWRFAFEGVHCSKADAGRWALARDPSLRAVEPALRQRSGDPVTPIAPGDIARILAVVRRELKTYAG